MAIRGAGVGDTAPIILMVAGVMLPIMVILIMVDTGVAIGVAATGLVTTMATGMDIITVAVAIGEVDATIHAMSTAIIMEVEITVQTPMAPVEVQITEVVSAVAMEISKKPEMTMGIWPVELPDDLTGSSTAMPIEAISAETVK